MVRTVIAAIDGSAPSEQALRWAAQEASLRGAPLRVLHVMEWPMQFAEGLHSREMRVAVAERAQELVDRSVDEVTRLHPELEVEGLLDAGHVSGVLVECSREVDLLVLGAPVRHHGLARLLGGTLGHLLSHAHCSLAVVPASSSASPGEVLVGVDAEPTSKVVLAAAFSEAQLRGVGVHALHAYERPPSLGPDDWVTPLFAGEGLHEAEEAVLKEALVGVRAGYPKLPVRTTVVNANPLDAFLEHAETAALVVVGAQGHGGFVGMLLGSVARSVATHAVSPTLVVRG